MVGTASRSAPTAQIGVSSLTGRVWIGLIVALLLAGINLMGLRLVGFQLIAFRGHSMEPTLSPGALLIARSAAPEKIQAGDIIAFSGAAGEPDIVHRIVSLEGVATPVARTMGDNNPVVDSDPVLLTGAVPRVLWSIPKAGWWFTLPIGRQMLVVGLLLAVVVATREVSRLTSQRRPRRRCPDRAHDDRAPTSF